MPWTLLSSLRGFDKWKKRGSQGTEQGVVTGIESMTYKLNTRLLTPGFPNLFTGHLGPEMLSAPGCALGGDCVSAEPTGVSCPHTRAITFTWRLQQQEMILQPCWWKILKCKNLFIFGCTVSSLLYMGFSLVSESGDCSLVVVLGLLITVASLVPEHEL